MALTYFHQTRVSESPEGVEGRRRNSNGFQWTVFCWEVIKGSVSQKSVFLQMIHPACGDFRLTLSPDLVIFHPDSWNLSEEGSLESTLRRISSLLPSSLHLSSRVVQSDPRQTESGTLRGRDQLTLMALTYFHQTRGTESPEEVEGRRRNPNGFK